MGASVLIIAVLVQILSSLNVSASPMAKHGVESQSRADRGMRSWLDFRQTQRGSDRAAPPGLGFCGLRESCEEVRVPGEEGFQVPARLGKRWREGRALNVC